MLHFLLLIPWFAGVLYSSIPFFWFAIHPLAGRWQRMRRSPYRLLLPLWAAMITALCAITWHWHARQIYSAWWAWFLALPFFLIGWRTYGDIGSAFGLARFTGQAELRPDEIPQTLVVTGLHATMRHPIYVAHLAVLTGWAAGSGLTVNFALLAVSVLCTFPLMIRAEERELEKRFGPAYLEYKKKVPVIPIFPSNRIHSG